MSSLDEVDVAASANDPLPGDKALAEAVRRELRKDAVAAALTLTVEVRECPISRHGDDPNLPHLIRPAQYQPGGLWGVAAFAASRTIWQLMRSTARRVCSYRSDTAACAA